MSLLFIVSTLNIGRKKAKESSTARQSRAIIPVSCSSVQVTAVSCQRLIRSLSSEWLCNFMLSVIMVLFPGEKDESAAL